MTQIAELVHDGLNALISFLTLEIIAEKQTWGYQIKKDVEKVISTEGFPSFEYKISSLYTILKRFERKRWIESKPIENNDNRPGKTRRFYAITHEGTEELTNSREAWKKLIAIFDSYPAFFKDQKKEEL